MILFGMRNGLDEDHHEDEERKDEQPPQEENFNTHTQTLLRNRGGKVWLFVYFSSWREPGGRIWQAGMCSRNAAGDALVIEELELAARLGVPEAERAHRQRLTASITLWPLAGFATLRDRIEAAVDYAAVVREVQETTAVYGEKLLETLAEAIASRLLARFPLARVRVELRKFILPGVKHVAVILTREHMASG